MHLPTMVHHSLPRTPHPLLTPSASTPPLGAKVSKQRPERPNDFFFQPIPLPPLCRLLCTVFRSPTISLTNLPPLRSVLHVAACRQNWKIGPMTNHVSPIISLSLWTPMICLLLLYQQYEAFFCFVVLCFVFFLALALALLQKKVARKDRMRLQTSEAGCYA